jgi:hypothetical protein
MRACRLLAALLVLVATTARAEPTPGPDAAPTPRPLWWQLKASIGYHFSVGDYTGSEDTVIQYVPLVLTADVERWRIQGTIPWIYVSGPAGIIDGPNGPIETNGTAGGLGDLLLRASYLLPVERLLAPDDPVPEWLPYVDAIGLIKFPTASRSHGLGTGEFDFGIESELTWTLGRWAPFCRLGYRFLGSPPEQHLYDVITASVGSLYRFSSALGGGALLDYRQPPTAQTGQRLELVPYLSWVVTPPWSLDGYVSIGLANGSPDVGFGSQLGYTW